MYLRNWFESYSGSLQSAIKNSEELIMWLIKYKPYNLLDGFNEIWLDFTFE